MDLRSYGVLAVGVEAEDAYLIHQPGIPKNRVRVIVCDDRLVGHHELHVRQPFLLQTTGDSIEDLGCFVRVDARPFGRIAIRFIKRAEVLKIDV